MKSVGTRRVGRAASTPEGLLKICNDCNADLVPPVVTLNCQQGMEYLL